MTCERTGKVTRNCNNRGGAHKGKSKWWSWWGIKQLWYHEKYLNFIFFFRLILSYMHVTYGDPFFNNEILPDTFTFFF